MTTSRHVLMNKSHRFWIFPLKQKQKSPNYILSYILNCFKHMLTCWPHRTWQLFPLGSCLLCPPCSWPIPALQMQAGAHQQSLWGCWRSPVPPAPTTEPRAGGGQPRATPFPGMGAHLLRAGQAPGQGGPEWVHDCLLPATTIFLFLLW